MRYWTGVAWCLALGFIPGCGGGGIGDTGSTYSDTDLYNPGMGGQGNIGPLNQHLPTDWFYLFGVETFGTLQECIDTGLCGHGGADLKFGTVISEDSLVYVLTANYIALDPNSGDPITVVVRGSGVEHDAIDVPATPEDKKLRLAFQYAFLTSRDVDGDSAVVQIVSDGNTASPLALLRIHSSELGETIALRGSGCGTERIPSDPNNPDAVETTYNRCSDWLNAELDISTFRGHSIKTQFVVGEAGADTDHGIALLVRQVRIQQED
jgi:hypothetical protein